MALTRINNNSLSNVTSAGLPSGSVIQVVTNELAGSSTNSGQPTDWTDTGLSITITPTAATSKILIFTAQVIAYEESTSHARIDYRCIEVGSSTELWKHNYHGQDGNTSITNLMQRQINGTGSFDCSSTSSLTFKTQARCANGGTNEANNLFLNWYAGSVHTITAMEIAG